MFRFICALAVLAFSCHIGFSQTGGVIGSDLLTSGDWDHAISKNPDISGLVVPDGPFTIRLKNDGVAFACQRFGLGWKDSTFNEEGIHQFKFYYAGTCELKTRELNPIEKMYFGYKTYSKIKCKTLTFDMKLISHQAPEKLKGTQQYYTYQWKKTYDLAINNHITNKTVAFEYFIDESRSGIDPVNTAGTSAAVGYTRQRLLLSSMTFPSNVRHFYYRLKNRSQELDEAERLHKAMQLK